MNHDTSYLRTTYARDKMIEQYNNEEKQRAASHGEDKALMAPRTDVLKPLPLAENIKEEQCRKQ
jgi:hypothetical protein